MRKFFLLFVFLGFSIYSQAQQQANEELSDELKEYFKKSILNKVRRLEHYISLIANKDANDNLRKSSIDQAVQLFEDENKIIQISNLKNGKETVFSKPVRTYFDRLYAIKADRVDITFYTVTQLTDVRLGPDKKYYATAYIFQDTKIYYSNASEIPDYSDRTEKAIDISIKPDTVLIGDKPTILYPAKLGNINVKETRSSK
jgi:hypothetical protein